MGWRDALLTRLGPGVLGGITLGDWIAVLLRERLALAPPIPPRRPMDQVEWDLRSPQEDEFALCAATCLSACMSWVLPGRRARFDRYLTFHGVSDVEIERWARAFQRFLKKVTVKYGPRPP